MKDRMSANEFREMLKNGSLDASGKKIRSSEKKLPNIFEKELDKIEPMFDTDKYVFIPGRVYSSKNTPSIRIKNFDVPSKWKCKINDVWRYVTPFVSKNDNALEYQKKTSVYYKLKVKQFKEMLEGKKPPYIIEFTFVVVDKGSWDFNNLTQLVQDCMVKAGMLPDDDVYNMLPTFPRAPMRVFYIDKDNPGIYFRVLNQ